MPDIIKNFEKKLQELEYLLNTKDLYKIDKITFDKTIIQITDIKNRLLIAEDEFLELQILSDEINAV